MHRAPALLLLLGCAIGNSAMAQAGGDVIKPIQGKVDQNAPKVRIDVGGNTAMLPAKLHEVKLEGGKKYQIDVVAKDELDPVIIVQDGAGKQLGFNDDVAPGNLNSRLTLEIARAGAYKLYVAALQHDDGSHGEGVYVLTVKQVGGAVAGGGATPQPIKGSVDQTAPKVRIEVGGKVASLPAKLHEMKLDGGKKYQFDVVAKDDLDPVVVIHDSTGKQLGFNDDVAPGNLNSRLTLDIAKAGVYKVYVAALKHDDGSHGEGDYVLTVKQLGGGGVTGDKVLDVGERGVAVKAALSRDAKALTYRVKLEQGKTYVIEMNSPNTDDLDPFLEVRDANGQRLVEDDDSGGNLNARLVFRAPASGVYQIVARSYMNVGVGDFTLSVKQQE